VLIAFVDECKSGNFALGISIVHSRDLKEVRQKLRTLRKPGQSRLHFAKESDARRKEILSLIRGLPVERMIVESSLKHHGFARDECLRRLVQKVEDLRVHQIVLEEDHSLVKRDNFVIRTELESIGATNSVNYFHESPKYEPCLWISDAILWANQKGGHWKVLAGLT
jgi:hypothetical protein